MAQIEYLLKLVLLIGISLVLICSGEKQAAQDHPQPAGESQAATSSTASQEDVPSDTGKPPLAEQGMMKFNLYVRLYREFFRERE